MAYITKSELRTAQRVLLGAGKMLGEVGLRLECTKYEADYKKAWNAVERLNSRLCKDIRKEEGK